MEDEIIGEDLVPLEDIIIRIEIMIDMTNMILIVL